MTRTRVIVALSVAIAVLMGCGKPSDTGRCSPEEIGRKLEALAADLDAAYTAKKISEIERTEAGNRLATSGIDFAKDNDIQKYCGTIDGIRHDLDLDKLTGKQKP